MSLIAGIDFSSFAVDIVLLDENTNLARHYTRRLDLGHKGDATQRSRRIPDVMPPRSWWRDNTIAVGLEVPFSRQGSDAMAIAFGAILACLPATRELLILRADDWRRSCGLPIRAGRDIHKANAKTFARKHWADHPPVFDDNAADALCIAWATRALLEARAAAAA